MFERHPNLKLVCVEADAGWAPHYMYRMDHAYKRHRYWLKGEAMEKLPSEYFLENVYMTFQDDWTAFKYRDGMNLERLMWGNDFPHSDATWPHSPELLAEHTADMRLTMNVTGSSTTTSLNFTVLRFSSSTSQKEIRRSA